MTALALLLLCFYATVVSGDETTVLMVEPGDVVLLPCYNVGNVTPVITSWTKNGENITYAPTTAPGSPSSSEARLAVLHDGSLNIRAVETGDEGEYLCASTLPGNITTFHARVLLQVASGPGNASIIINPTTVLPNGTLTIKRGSSVDFFCSGVSYPSPQLTWSFTGQYNNSSLVTKTGPWLEYRMENIQPNAQGNYTCNVHNNISHKEVNKSAELLVYYASDRHPECMWTTAKDPTFVVFHCSWFGTYPSPTLNWTEVTTGRVLASSVGESLAVTINSSLLFDGETVQCKAHHPALTTGDDKSCEFTLKYPYPVGEPLATALDGTNTTFTCSETTSTPPANTTWRRGLKQDLIMNASKYIITVEGSLFKLTIVNITKDDEGVYFCHSQNPLGVRELEVYLTVKTSSAYMGAVIGLFIAVLIVGSAIVIAKTVYSSRHKICLDGFGKLDEDKGDVLSLVESDDEQIFQASVPRLPPVSNGCQTTLVEIHRIPSTDHEEAETTDGNAQQPDNNEKTEEPEDLVTI